LSIDRALTDARLLGGALGDLSPWSLWLVVLKAAFGLPLEDAERATFRKVAGDRPPPGKRVRELWAVETGQVLVLAATQDQAKTVFDYCVGFVEASEALRREVRAITAHEIRLANDVMIGVHVNSYRTIRGNP
jgi:hypothetical protein